MSADLKAISEDKPAYVNVGRQLKGPAQRRKKKPPLLPQKSTGQAGFKQQEMRFDVKTTAGPLSASTSQLCDTSSNLELHAATFPV